MENKLCQDLLSQWCKCMLELQITDNKDDGLYGGILCPACSRVHGRCMDALYPFMYMADSTGDIRYLQAAKLLFDWAERVVSRDDGSYVNDTNADWKGITVFSAIGLAEAIQAHGHLLDDKTLLCWKQRLAKAAAFLEACAEINNNNINYRVTNILAMHYCGKILNNKNYAQAAKESAAIVINFISQEGFLFGEGSPSDGYTKRGARAIDIGYNVEESLPALAIYAHETQNEALEQEVARAMSAHLQFMLSDGGWDNSFGSRNFKWTYWGSRTSDGSLLGMLLLKKYNSAFLTAAQRNLELLSSCSHSGLLHGGPHYHYVKERPCVHHTFTHAKVLAGILDHKLSFDGEGGELPYTKEGITHFKDIDTYRINCNSTLATVTFYDWEYLLGGHASGGNISMLYHPNSGPVLCASMSEYSMREPNNMQLQRFSHHECLTPALYLYEGENSYTTLYDFDATADICENNIIQVSGQVADITHFPPTIPLSHTTKYSFNENGVDIDITLNSNNGEFICPIISCENEKIILNNNVLIIEKPTSTVTLTVACGNLSLPYNENRCYNLVGGFQAIKTVITPINSKLQFSIIVNKTN